MDVLVTHFILPAKRVISLIIDCNSKNVIYMVHCNRCHKQYIGNQNDDLKTVLTSTVDQLTNKQNSSKFTTVSEHFLSNGHRVSHQRLIALELIKSNGDSARKAREAYLIERGQTLEPLGLNRRVET